MKKIISLIPAAVMFIIVIGLFVFMCLPQNQSRVTAENGVLDLRGESDIAPLNGQWEFVYGELLTPKDFDSYRAGLINVPSSWDEEGWPLLGFATYRLTVLTDLQEPLTLYLPEIHTAYTLWINGEIADTAGVASGGPAESRVLYKNALIPARAENGVIELVIQASNYHEIQSGLTASLLLGESQEIQSWFIRTRALAAIALGCILMAAFYHLTLYIYRRREIAYLMFAGLCFLCFARFLMESNGLNAYFQWIPENIYGIYLYYTLAIAHSLAVIAFTLYIFDQEFFRKYRTPLLGYFAFFFIGNMVMPIFPAVYLGFVAVTSLAPLALCVIVAVRSRAMKEDSTMRLYFAALLLYIFVGFTAKIFLDNVLFMTGLVTNMFMVMVQSMVLSRRYTDAFRFVEETNTNLEQIVDERTKSLQAANEAMLTTNNAMKELVTNISHDLKTPLHVMSINLETLSELTTTQSDAVYQRHVRVAYQKNLDLQRLIRNLFEVSRIETDKNIYSPKWESILSLLAEIKEKYDIYAEDQGIIFEVNVEDDLEISIDPQKIWSVFDNIIFNAVRHTESGGSVTITAHNTESSATVTITDTGCGIAGEHLPHIFERFYKGSQARSANEGESGLGLYIVKSIMEGCGGSVDAKSEVGKGTSIILTFPARMKTICS